MSPKKKVGLATWWTSKIEVNTASIITMASWLENIVHSLRSFIKASSSLHTINMPISERRRARNMLATKGIFCITNRLNARNIPGKIPAIELRLRNRIEGSEVNSDFVFSGRDRVTPS